MKKQRLRNFQWDRVFQKPNDPNYYVWADDIESDEIVEIFIDKDLYEALGKNTWTELDELDF